ncbi:transcriptional regulator [Deinococcus malanensis]|uniref:Transcriptional regulator n=1 Tax=Deinococcus malanensis TaxID=1706855 RepID=A0ABQ2F2H1_9DEIO|nr:transcriptional regulator [Deinococcus malanensis]GGK40725.1 transcriptional regulator [Deinococcus malanensis]
MSESTQLGAMEALLGLDRVIHEPVRLAILSVLAGVQEAEFRFMESTLGLSKGNLSSHATKLEEAGYLEVNKAFRGKVPVTSYRITETGCQALDGYWAALRGAAPGS